MTLAVDNHFDKENMNTNNGSVANIGSVKSEMGIILEIYCENFMCHEKLRVSLGPNMNFITGQNGSGKSAIIAALQICLGASAKVTDRATSLKKLIRREHNGSALARITLLNSDAGSDAFEYETYGDKITVERIIHQNGSTDYRLKDSEGRIKSRSKKDLDKMLDHLNIQIENPCAVLGQDQAKRFLKGDPRDKYMFFLKSTDLFNMKNKYKEIKQECDILEANRSREEAKLQLLEQAKDAAEAKVKEAEEINQLEGLQDETKLKLIWSMVREIKVGLDEMKAEKSEKERKAGAYNQSFEEVSTVLDSIREKQTRKTVELSEVQQKMAENEAAMKKHRLALKEARRPLGEAKSDLKGVISERATKKKSIARTQEKMERAINEYEEAHNDDLAQKIAARVGRLEEELQSLQEASGLGEGSGVSQSDVHQLSDEINRCEAQMREHENTIQRAKRDITALKGQKANDMSKFGSFVPSLMKEIKANAKRFSAPPIGPLGAYVNLPSECDYMKVAITRVIGNGMLGSFLLATGRDLKVFNDIRKKLRCNENNGIVSKRANYRYQNLSTPSDPYLADRTISNVLSIPNDNVFNALVDVCGIESKVVFETREEAQDRIILGSNGNNYLPEGVSHGYLAQRGDEISVRSRNFYSSHYNHNGVIILGTNNDSNNEQEIAKLNSNIEEWDRQLSVMRSDYRNMKSNLSKMRISVANFENQARKNEDKILRVRRELDNQRAQLQEANEDSYPAVISEYKAAIEVANGEVQNLDEMVQELETRIDELNADLSSKTSHESSDLKDASEEYAEVFTGINQDLEALDNNYTASLTKQRSLERKIEKLNGDINALTQSLNQKEAEYLARRERSLQKSNGVEIELNNEEETTEYLSEALRNIQDRIRTEKQNRNMRNQEDLSSLRTDASIKAAKFAKKRNQLDLLYQNQEAVAKNLRGRKKRWKALRDAIQERTGMVFNRHMNARSHAGKLNFNDKDQSIDIVVTTSKGGGKVERVRDMKQLSGGERSYTQTALLLALGESTESPFRVLDEFDVFMDSENRKITLDALINAAKSEPSKQFILVTPNDLSCVEKHDMVVIKKLDAPRSSSRGASSSS